ncbi:MAG: hypothetical protein NTV39_01930 [Candidatus Saccharibacteria bacterium]|nr:hypothetical protein [Candidatus Saccharibacteria bacterium]
MKEIVLATSNDRKIREARAGCDHFDIKVNQLVIDIDEIQHHNPIEISKDKAKKAFEITGKPVVVTDTSWNIHALNGFPGGYMKDVAQWFSTGDFLNLVKKDRRISFTETIVYQDSKESKVFSQDYLGKISKTPRGSGNSIDQLAEFDGYTLGERHNQNSTSHDSKDYIWYQFAKWFSER